MNKAYLRSSSKPITSNYKLDKVNKNPISKSHSNIDLNISTFEKICKLQSLLKEVASMKERFVNNKEKMIIQIEKNCFNFFKSKIAIKEIYDYISSKKYINYTLSEDIQNDLASSYELISPLIFSFRNSNKKILQLIEKCPKENYDYLSNFLVNFFYENILNPSFCQDDFMVIIYLLLEKIIENNSLNDSCLTYLENTFLYYLFINFTRKEDIRNYLCDILSDLILNIEKSVIGTLSPEIYKINEFLIEKNNEINKFQNLEKNDLRQSLYEKSKLSDSIYITYNVNEVLNDFSLRQSLNIMNVDIGKLNLENEIKEKENISEKIDFEAKNAIEMIFKQKDININLLKEILSEYEKKVEKKELGYEINLLMVDYLKRQIKNSKENKEIYSNKIFLEELEKISITKSKNTFNEITNFLILNFENIKRIIEKLINDLLSNINTIPYSLKCICKIISSLITNKFNQLKTEISKYEKLMFISTFFLGNILIPTIINPDFCGIVTSNVISEKTKENLNIISKIINQILEGNLFNNNNNPSYTIFNSFIIEIMPKIFEFFLNVGINITLPTIIEGLFKSYKEENQNINSNISDGSGMIKTSISKEKKNRDIDINYNDNQSESIIHQSICFDRKIILIIIEILKNNEKFFIEEYPELKTMIENIIMTEEFFKVLMDEDNKMKKVTFNCISRIIYNHEFQSKINKIISNRFFIYNPEKDKSEISKFKKCLCEVLSFINILHKENFTNSDIFSFFKSLSNEKDEKINKENINNENNEKEDIDFLNIVLPKMLLTLKEELDFNINSEEEKKLIFCATFLQLNIKNIPKEYSMNNYNKLFIELIHETESSIKDLQVNIINQYYSKVKNVEKINMIVTNNLNQIKQMEKCINIKNLYNTIICPVKLTTIYDSNNNELIKVSIEEDSSPNALKKIHLFIENFPDFRNEKNKSKNPLDDDDILSFEEKLGINDVLNTYFSYIKKILKNEPLMLKYSHEEFLNMNYELDNYILSKLYNKLFPENQTKKDLKFYKKCLRLDFLKPENIIKDKKMINEKLWITAMNNINEMDIQNTPTEKIKCFNKAFGILQNSITFCSGKDELGVDDSITILEYVFLKTKPKMMFSNMNYSMLYIDSESAKKQYGMLLTQMNMIVTIIENMKFNDLINVSEEDFGVDEI